MDPIKFLVISNPEFTDGPRRSSGYGDWSVTNCGHTYSERPYDPYTLSSALEISDTIHYIDGCFHGGVICYLRLRTQLTVGLNHL